MQKASIILFFLSLIANTYSQDYDLIVRTNGDSIACHIDSITTTQIFFEMRFNGVWIHTHIDKNEVIKYDLSVEDIKTNDFIPGTSIVKPQTGNKIDINPKTTFEIRKNSIYIELGGTGAFWSLINYDRIIPITNRIAFVPRIGIGMYDELYPVYELNFIFGQRHFFETGFGQYMFFNTFPEKDFMIRAGYRYHGRKGFLFRIAPQLYRVAGDIHDNLLQFWFGLSLGYSF